MTKTELNDLELARLAAAGDAGAYEQLQQRLFDFHGRTHPTYRDIVQQRQEHKLSLAARKVGWLTALTRRIFDLPDPDMERLYDLLDAEYEAEKDYGRRAGNDLQRLMSFAIRERFGLTGDDDDYLYPRRRPRSPYSSPAHP